MLLAKLSTSSVHRAGPESTVGNTTAEDEAKRFELLKFTYVEVLDATKHQDDKINRLLTTVAFLTAAALALAGLDGGEPVRARFVLDHGERLPLGLLTLGGFLVGVAASVVMLVASLTTPLRFPGGHKATIPDIAYVPGPDSGQVYFNEISSAALPEWWVKWRSPSSDLIRERNESLIRETHNLAVRTDFKYQRSNEAVAVLSFALMSFGLSVVLVLISAAHQGSPSDKVVDVAMDWHVRTLLAVAIFVFYWLQLLATRQDLPDTVLEHAHPLGCSASRQCLKAYPVVLAAVPALLLLRLPGPHDLRLALAVVVPVIAWVVFLLALLPNYLPNARHARRTTAQRILANVPGADLVADQLPQDPLHRDPRLQTFSLMAVIVAAGVATIELDRYAIAMAVAYGYGLLLVAASVLKVAKQKRKRVRRFRERLRTYPEHTD